MIKTEFYRITTDTDTVTPRYAVPPSYDRKAANAQGKLRFDQFPDFEPRFSDLYIETNTPTDFIYDGGAIAGYGFILSGRAKKIFESSGAPNVRFYPLNMRFFKEGGGVKMTDAPPLSGETWYMQIIRPSFETWVDYDKSVFERVIEKTGERTPLNPDGPEELSQLIGTRVFPDYNDVVRLYLHPPSPADVAVFHLWPMRLSGGSLPIISAGLKAKLEAENISGYVLHPLPEKAIIAEI